jgi:hypothetical protein
MKEGETEVKQRQSESERQYEINQLHGADASYRMLIFAQLLTQFCDFYGT